MKKLLATLVLLAPLTAAAANFVGTEGNDNINGTDEDDTFDLKGGNDSTIPGCGNDVVDVGSGNDIVFSTCGNLVVTGTTGDKDIIVQGVGVTSSITLGDGTNSLVYFNNTGDANITLGTGENAVGCPTANCTVVAGDGDNTISGGSSLLTVPPGTAFNATTGSGNDIIYDGPGDSGVIDTGAGADDIGTIFGDPVIIAGEGEDFIRYGLGNSIGYGGEGADKFQIRAESMGDGDKEVIDFTGEDLLDFSSLKISKEQVLNSIVIVENPPFLLSTQQIMASIAAVQPEFNVVDKMVVFKYFRESLRAHLVSYHQARKEQRLTGKANKVVWKSKHFKPFMLYRGTEPTGRSVEKIWAEVSRECKRRVVATSGAFSLVGEANANPDPEAGDILFQGANASLLIKDGVALIANGEITPDNILTQF